MADRTMHTCSHCGNRFDLPPVATFTDRLSGAVPGHVPFGAYVYAVCPSCGRKDWAEGRKFYGLIGPRTFYAIAAAVAIGIVLLVVYLGFFFKV